MTFKAGHTYKHENNKDVAFHVTALDTGLDSYVLSGYWYNLAYRRLHAPIDIIVVLESDNKKWSLYVDE